MSMGTIKVAPAAVSVLTQATQRWPKRRKASDGTIGDKAHRRRVSDHNPDSTGTVYAVDLTNDPAHGIDAHAWIRWYLNTKQPGWERVKYGISNGQVWEHDTQVWRHYDGENKHTKHAHLSIKPGYRNDTRPWFNGWGSAVVPPSVTPPPPTPTAEQVLRLVKLAIDLAKLDIKTKGPVGPGSSRKEIVKIVQRGLQQRAQATIVDDGDYGPQTEQWVRWFQGTRGVKQTGIVDSATMNLLFP